MRVLLNPRYLSRLQPDADARCSVRNVSVLAWVQEAVRDGFVDMRRVPTDDNTSDVFTKTLGADVIDRLRPGLTGYGPLPLIPNAMPT